MVELVESMSENSQLNDIGVITEIGNRVANSGYWETLASDLQVQVSSEWLALFDKLTITRSNNATSRAPTYLGSGARHHRRRADAQPAGSANRGQRCRRTVGL